MVAGHFQEGFDHELAVWGRRLNSRRDTVIDIINEAREPGRIFWGTAVEEMFGNKCLVLGALVLLRGTEKRWKTCLECGPLGFIGDPHYARVRYKFGSKVSLGWSFCVCFIFV